MRLLTVRGVIGRNMVWRGATLAGEGIKIGNDIREREVTHVVFLTAHGCRFRLMAEYTISPFRPNLNASRSSVNFDL